MKGSFQIAKLFGIPVQIHWTFGLVFVWVLYEGFVGNWGWASIAWSMMFVLALFVCVVMHEFGHALTARRYGVSTRDIILSPIGGIARLERLPEKPMQEFYVAIAGPLVNVGIMALLSPYLLSVTEDQREQLFSIFNKSSNVFTRDLTPLDLFLFGLIFLNGSLAVFNLLPAFPMDGGRVLRALLSLKLGRMRATRIAAYVGQFLAVALLIYGIWQGSPITAFIGVFVFLMAGNEFRMVRMDTALENYTVADIVRSNFTKIYLTDSMETIANTVAHGWEKSFLVFDQWQNLKGVLPEANIMKAVKQKAFDQPVTHFLDAKYEPLLLQDSLKNVFWHIQQNTNTVYPVYDRSSGQLAGILDPAMLHNFLKMKGK
ncbi:MAG: site-2 protease family protein [Saprospiraceae bacterium]|nr:site-2 protease family protein [Saprospiraceae bacterium]